MSDSKDRAMQIVGYNKQGDREKDDFYATPVEATVSLLKAEKFEGSIYEPCCGEGHISKVLEAHGYQVKSSDLIDRGYGKPRQDFLFERQQHANIVTNPPYKNALDFVEQAVELSNLKCALLLKLSFLEGQKRKLFFEARPPSRIHVFSQRQSLMKNGDAYKGGMMALAWFLWDKEDKSGEAKVKWL
tara:strand:+ start:99 stop:659 length:561 start_codon:yes stop_codon:yes gene_type:complete